MDAEWMISQSGEGKPIKLKIGPVGEGDYIKLSFAEAELLGSQLVRRARENGAEPWVMDRGSSIHGEGACLVLLDQRERVMISNAFSPSRNKRDGHVAKLMKKIRWMI